MSQQKRGLGKGLGALIPTAPAGQAGIPAAGYPRDGAAAAPATQFSDPAGAYFDEIPVASIIAESAAAAGRSSTRRRSPNWPRRSRWSGFFSRWSSGAPGRVSTSS